MRRGGLNRLVIVAVVSALAAVNVSAQSVPEYNAKAGFLTTFLRYATWPGGDGGGSAAMVCVLGADPFGTVLDLTAAASRGVRPVKVRRIASPAEAAGCQIVFISRAESKRESEWLSALGNSPVLTVGESGHTVQRGGAVEFTPAADRVAFDVNLPAAERAGVRLSSDLLAHARTVYR